MENLSDGALIDAYIQAKQKKLDSYFIRQLEKEINRRFRPEIELENT